METLISKIVPLYQWIYFQDEWEKQGWKLRGYSEYIYGIPRYAELVKGE